MSWIKGADKSLREKQLTIGVDVESEHKDTIEAIRKNIKDDKLTLTNEQIFEMIASDHLKEDAEYYSKLAKAKL